ncbi:MAG: hypothetical protein JRI59_09175, partial [Deltaproteobacteria bacterium]|nr:hypothetical protein [Deltaproteobacteria bacterium]
FLQVRPEDILPKVKECWSALFSPAATAYRLRQGLSDSGGMGVIIQQQIQPSYAGVAFSLDPALQSTDQVVIEWVEGLGEALVSGQVTPHRLRLRRKAPLVPEEMPPALASALQELLPLLLQAEKLFGHPLDVEWCVDGAGLHILQARPVTGLLGQDLVLWSNVNIGENYPQALSPFTWSVVEAFRYGYFRSLFRHLGLPPEAIREAAPVIRNLIGLQGGRVYYNLTNWYEMLALFPLTRWFRNFLDHYIGQHIPFTYLPRRPKLRLFRDWRLLPLNLWFWVRLGWNYLTLERQVARFEAEFYRARRNWRSRPLAACSLEELDELLQDIMDFLNRRWGRAALADLGAMIFPGLLDLLAGRWLADASGQLTARLLRGISVKSTEGLKLIWDLARKMDREKKLRQLLLDRQYGRLEQSLNAELTADVARFLEHFGGRCYHELLITSPTFEERRDLFWDLVRSYHLSPDRNPRDQEQEEARERDRFAGECLARLSLVRRVVFRRVLKKAQQAIRAREAVRLCQSLIYGELRRVALELGAKLAARGHLEAAEEVFLLTYQEVSRLCQGKFWHPEGLPEILAGRKRAWEAAQARELPEFFILPRGRYFENFDQIRASAPDRKVFRGLGVSGGRTEGRARVIHDPARDRGLEPGEILVAKTTDPGWTPLFMVAGGLVLEKGGLLSHGAIVAREFGIPAVVGVEGATRLLAQAPRLLVDGTLGEVIILAEATEAG